MNKKGVELSMNLIIIAAIGLLVLVILAVLVIGSANKTNEGLKSCNVQLGICQRDQCSSPDDIIPASTNGKALCTTSKPYCCKVVSTG
jgi:hypothetical protein